ncbi:MAG: hypothetical protein PWP23_348 [Candidatus Sumerlaeota bacterium]|nr:hypothetical protein [Candidatus Sumerlaeota bacterium]
MQQHALTTRLIGVKRVENWPESTANKDVLTPTVDVDNR